MSGHLEGTVTARDKEEEQLAAARLAVSETHLLMKQRLKLTSLLVLASQPELENIHLQNLQN